MNLRSWLRGLTVLAIGACLPGTSSTVAAPAPAAPAHAPAPARAPAQKSSVGKPKATVYTPRNHHLRTATTPTAHKTLSLKAKTAKPTSPGSSSTTSTRRVRHTPRTAASVSGTVYNMRGGPALGARVWLAKGNGPPIRSATARHGTRTDSSGSYSMRGVKSGRYRVVAQKRGVGRGHHGLMIRGSGSGGAAHHANINLKRGQGKTQPRR